MFGIKWFDETETLLFGLEGKLSEYKELRKLIQEGRKLYTLLFISLYGIKSPNLANYSEASRIIELMNKNFQKALQGLKKESDGEYSDFKQEMKELETIVVNNEILVDCFAKIGKIMR